MAPCHSLSAFEPEKRQWMLAGPCKRQLASLWQIVKMKVRHSGAHSQVFECQAHGTTGQETLAVV
jgi:hypothetical protein